ncbi:chitobiase/beta-hexosaminidase C-terminal domain-containing protein [Cellulosimicrobium sp. PMB13]|uniref:chitobiase/beta-hexosaminidase C-terminal domain-containing protein n=1 Tax=Cellulosimicrobium sp. PMB13 TaxID=3120158 RepID=UPI003F4B6DB2
MPFAHTLTAVVAIVTSTLAAIALPAAATSPPSAVVADELAPPTFSVAGGRFTGPTTVALSAPAGAEIRYTLDGSTPTTASALYTGPLTVAESSNVAAVAVRDGAVSRPEVEGYLVKTAEEPLLSFVVLSDIETTTYDDASRARWDHYFDVITSLQPEPDLILSNGDQIADNYYDSGEDHRDVRALLEDGLSSHGLDGTRVLMSFGNHDDRLAVMTQHYPTEWFPHAGGGYYEQEIEGVHFLVLNTEAYGAEQRAWVRERLAAIAAEPGALGRPVFVVGHRPTTGTVNDGAQASNPAIAQDLAPYPQAVYVSGHSHLNLNSEKSIHQRDFTAVNDGSMSYSQIPRDSYQDYGDVLVDNFTLPVPQGLLVEVYADRTEIDRVAFSAEPRRTYDATGAWSPYPPTVPTPSAGTLAGPTWTLRLDGDTPEDVRAGFAYTDAARADRTPPTLGAAPTVHVEDGVTRLSIPAAHDDRLVHGYEIRVTDTATGALALPFRAGTVVSSDSFFSPRPSVLDVPLAIRQGIAATAPVVGLTDGTSYVATVRAVDSWGNRSEPVSVGFVAGVEAPEVVVSSSTRCLAGRAYVAVRATYAGTGQPGADAPVAIGLTTPFGTRVAVDVAPGASVYQSFAVRSSSVAAGEASIRVTDAAGAVTEQVSAWPALTC